MRHLTLVLALLAAPAAAQDGSEPAKRRSLEDAQSFLAEFYRSLGRTVEVSDGAWMRNGSWELGPKPSGYTDSATVDATLRDVTPSGRCTTKITVEGLRKYSPYAYERGDVLPTPATVQTTIDWSGVTSVKVSRQKKLKRTNPPEETELSGWYVDVNGPSGLSFLHGDEEAAKRAAFAMQFLKEQCGFKTETGF